MVRWKLTHFNGDTYMLDNIGDKTAIRVEASVAEDSHLYFRKPPVQDLPAHEALTFMAGRTFGTSDSTITIQWSDPDTPDRRHEWRFPLPPKPSGR